MKTEWDADSLIEFEKGVADLFEAGKINCPVHLSGGNESMLMYMFEPIKEKDYVFSTHRNHYHYLLKGGSAKGLLAEILGKKTGICGGKRQA